MGTSLPPYKKAIVCKVVDAIIRHAPVRDGKAWLSRHLNCTTQTVHALHSNGALNAETHRTLMRILRSTDAYGPRIVRTISKDDMQSFERLEIHLNGGSIDPSSFPQLPPVRHLEDARIVVMYAIGALLHSGLAHDRLAELMGLSQSGLSNVKRHPEYVSVPIYHRLMRSIRESKPLHDIVASAKSHGGSNEQLLARLKECESLFAITPKRHTTQPVAVPKRAAAPRAAAPTKPIKRRVHSSDASTPVAASRDAIVLAISAMIDEEIKQATQDRDQRIAQLEAAVAELTMDRDEWKRACGARDDGVRRMEEVVTQIRASDHGLRLHTLNAETRAAASTAPVGIAPARATPRPKLPRGKYPKVAPYGFCIVHGAITPHPQRYAILQRIINWRKHHHNWTQIADILNCEGVPSAQDKAWNGHMVSRAVRRGYKVSLALA